MDRLVHILMEVAQADVGLLATPPRSCVRDQDVRDAESRVSKCRTALLEHELERAPDGDDRIESLRAYLQSLEAELLALQQQKRHETQYRESVAQLRRTFRCMHRVMRPDTRPSVYQALLFLANVNDILACTGAQYADVMCAYDEVHESLPALHRFGSLDAHVSEIVDSGVDPLVQSMFFVYNDLQRNTDRFSHALGRYRPLMLGHLQCTATRRDKVQELLGTLVAQFVRPCHAYPELVFRMTEQIAQEIAALGFVREMPWVLHEARELHTLLQRQRVAKGRSERVLNACRFEQSCIRMSGELLYGSSSVDAERGLRARVRCGFEFLSSHAPVSNALLAPIGMGSAVRERTDVALPWILAGLGALACILLAVLAAWHARRKF